MNNGQNQKILGIEKGVTNPQIHVREYIDTAVKIRYIGLVHLGKDSFYQPCRFYLTSDRG